MIKINTSGDYVQLIYVDPVDESVQQELKSDTDAFECSYDSDGKLFMQFGAMRFENPDPTDFTINGVAVTDAADFISKLNALFTGGGWGTTGTIATLTGNSTVDLDGNILSINQGANFFLLVDPTLHTQQVQIKAYDATGDGNVGRIDLSSTDVDTRAMLIASFNDDEFKALIEATAGASGDSAIAYTADAHTFNGEMDYNGNAKLLIDREIDLDGHNLNINDGATQLFRLEPTVGAELFQLIANNGTGTSTLVAYANTDDGYYFQLVTNSGFGSTIIKGESDGFEQSIEYTADTHTFTGTIVNPTLIPLDFVDDAAAAAGGVVVGQLYHTAGAVKIRLS